MPATDTPLKTQLMVGLEIHVELATESKMFTAAPNVAHPANHHADPNTLLDPVVIGMPGTLPVVNRKAVEMSILVGLALHCEIAKFTKWDRKSYYYPDLPKNYQISQYDLPICGQGWLDAPVNDEPDAPTKKIRITRAHLEEDAGKLLHEAPGGAPINYSIVDLNRAGTPLLEIVTEPDFETAQQVVEFCQLLRDICRHLGVTQGIMQMGHIRFEPNINVLIEKEGVQYRTPIAEIKNLNSFKAVRGSIDYEYYRQVEEWKKTGDVMGKRAKSTRGWDGDKNVTILQRQKEDEDEYRYFPDPDLVPLVISEQWIKKIKIGEIDWSNGLIELPRPRLARYVKAFGLALKPAKQLVDDPALTQLFEKVIALGAEADRTCAILLNAGAKRANEQSCSIDKLGISPEQIKDIITLQAADKIGSSAADRLFGECCESNETAQTLAKKHGLLQVSDTGALEGFIDQVLGDAKNAKIVADIKAGKGKAVGALMGQIMKLSKGKANPKRVTELIMQKLQS